MPVALIDGIVVLGVGVVIPLALAHPRRWAVVTVAVVASLVVANGAGAAAVALVWFAVAAYGLVETLRIAAGSKLGPVRIADVVASAFACVAAVAYAWSRAGLSILGIGEPIVELTAVHFTFAGVGAVALAGLVARTHRIARAVALVFTISVPPVVALGFLFEHPVPQAGGAVLLAIGVLATAAMHLSDARCASGVPRFLLVVSGLAPWIPMALAVAWAISLYADVLALGIAEMVRTHGVMNAVFVVAGLVARTLQRRLRSHGPTVASTLDPLWTAAP